MLFTLHIHACLLLAFENHFNELAKTLHAYNICMLLIRYDRVPLRNNEIIVFVNDTIDKRKKVFK